MLGELSKPGKSVTIYKSDINVTDLSALTAKTEDEFAMFTLGSRRMIIRGTSGGVDLPRKLLTQLQNNNWKWSAHTHPGSANLTPSGLGGDRGVLLTLDQEQSLILNSLGRRRVFNQIDGDYIDPLPRPKG